MILAMGALRARYLTIAFAALSLTMPAAGLVLADIRVALVIGNGHYPGAPLANPENDAHAVAEALRKLRFEVVEVDDAKRQDILNAEDGVRAKLNEHPGTALLYYAGHGVQLDWVNYIVPTDAHLASAEDAPTRAVSVASIIENFKKAGSRTTLIILDACRDNPFGGHASGKGLAGMDAPTDTLLAYATAPGNVASDGEGEHGLYTGHLLEEMQRPSMRIEDVFKRVRLAVRVQSKGSQIPWESTSLESDFYFTPPTEPIKRTHETDAAQLDAELHDWDTIKGSDRAEDYITYLGKYPSGFFSEAAQFRLDHLQAPRVTPQPAPVVVVGERDSSPSPVKVEPLPSGVNRYRVGDVFEWQTTDHWTQKTRKSKETITYADDKTVVSNGGTVVRDQMGNMMKNPFGEITPFISFEPADMSIGKKWRTAFRNASREGVMESDFYDFRVASLEYVTVPAGTFLAYRLEGTGYVSSTSYNHPIEQTRWVDPKTYFMIKLIRKFGPTSRPNVWETLELVKFTPGPR